MSQEQVEELRQELALLREDHEALSSEVVRLRRSLAGLRAASSSAPSEAGRPARTPTSDLESFGSYSPVTGLRIGSSVAPSTPDGRRDPSSEHSEGRSSAPLVGPSGPASQITWQQREVICDGVAEWVVKALGGVHRGSSGRERNPVASRYWLIFKDYQGNEYNPPLCYRLWTPAKGLVKRGSDCGSSVFIGLPTERECVRVVTVAGLEWSGEIRG